MRITLNGKEQETGTATVAELLEELDLAAIPFLAVSRNGAVVKRADRAATLLAEGDTIDILTIVGGG